MQVNSLLVDEIKIRKTDGICVVGSTLYTFDSLRWISSHKGRAGKRLGPMALLKLNDSNDDMNGIEITKFPKRPLDTTVNKTLVVSYRDRWTIPAWTSYTIVLPKDFVLTRASIKVQDGNSWKHDFMIGVTSDGHLFYHAFFGGNGQVLFDIEARIERDNEKYNELVASLEVVEGSRRFADLGTKIGRQLLTPDMFMKLLEWAGKYIPS